MKSRSIVIVCLLTASIKIFSQSYGSWVVTDSMNYRRDGHAAIQLENRNVLVVGGNIQTEIFDINTKKWSLAAPLNKNRVSHALVKLSDGSIIAIGGFNEATCEILDKDYSAWTFTDSLKTRRYYGQTVTLMQDGNILLTGGDYTYHSTSRDTAFKECEVYNSVKKKWKAGKDMNVGRTGHTATLLKDGRILVTGGQSLRNGTTNFNTCEIYNPQTDEWKIVAPMHYQRANHSATLLSNGKVLIIGGTEYICELYDPIENTWKDVGPISLSLGPYKVETINNEEYLLLLNTKVAGWELYSLRDFKSVYKQKFSRNIIHRILEKIDESHVLTSGGQEALLAGDDLIIIPVSLSLIYDFNVTGIERENEQSLPAELQLSCYPNPFNPTTVIKYNLPKDSFVTLKVYDILGKEIAMLVNENKQTGYYNATFNANNLPSGIYIYSIKADGFNQSKKMMLTK